MVCTRIAELADTQAGSRQKSTFLLFPVLQLSDPHVPFFLPNSRFFFSLSLYLKVRAREGGVAKKGRIQSQTNESKVKVSK